MVIMWLARLLRAVFIFIKNGVFPQFAVLKIVLFPVYFASLVVSIFCKKPYAQRVRQSLEEGGPVFIKLGQSISLKPYLCRQETITALSQLQESVSPVDINLEGVIPQKVRTHLKSISQQPVSSGSIAQVYRGVISERSPYAHGVQRQVAIKIVKNGVGIECEKDLTWMLILARIINVIPSIRRLKPVKIVEDMRRDLKKEQNLLNELNNMEQIRQNTILDKELHIPMLYKDLCSERVLIMEWLHGQSLRKFIEGGSVGKVQKSALVQSIMHSYLKQVYRDGFFHADLHPGNIFINDSGGISLIDFGIVGRLSRQDRLAVMRIVDGFKRQDYATVVSAHIEAGYVPEWIDISSFYDGISSIGGLLRSGVQGSFSMSSILRELFSVMHHNKVEVQERLLMLYKTIFYIEAVITMIDPGANVWHMASGWLSLNGRRFQFTQRTSQVMRVASRVLARWGQGIFAQKPFNAI